MPESKVRKAAADKKKLKRQNQLVERREERQRISPDAGSGKWVVPAFVTCGLLGVAWLVVYYLAGQSVPGMSSLGDWNILIGMGMMAAAFVIATFWK
ncbi:cell division protein CrgA [Enemella sp. A6]|uniref:cell division protein CrgA n=1 Tax=Enemella sp. A6 TaxID=3440152 RepID=UPI003EB6CD77